jgi:alpha-glucosidase (family GH31 glycosyl hydrolase)
LAHDGRTGEELHNAYPVLSARAAHDFNERVRPNDHLFFVRGGGVGTQAFAPAVWGGDAEASFDQTQGLPAMLRGGVNLGLSGVPYFGADAQGYKCLNEGVDRNKELFYRWLQFSAVNPIMQDQDRCFALTTERTKWFIWDDQETGDEYARYASLHVRLQPYFLALAQEAHATGMPIMRHPFLMHRAVPDVTGITDAFYLGPSLYTLPVVRRGQFSKTAWIPPGRWVDWWTRQIVDGGGAVTLDTPVTTLPLLLAENTLVPMLDPAVQTLAPATVPGVVTAQSTEDRLDVVVALSPGGTASFTLADGTVLLAQRVPANAGNPLSLSTATEAQLPGCAECFLGDVSGETQRLRVNSAQATASTLTVEDVVLRHQGNVARRVRWEVLRLP